MNQPRQYTNSQYPTQYPNQFNNSQQQPQQQFPQQPAANFGETSQIGDNNMNQMMNQNQMNPSQTMSINQHGQVRKSSWCIIWCNRRVSRNNYSYTEYNHNREKEYLVAPAQLFFTRY